MQKLTKSEMNTLLMSLDFYMSERNFDQPTMDKLKALHRKVIDIHKNLPTPRAADDFSGHANNCVLRSGGYACTCGAELGCEAVKESV